MESTIDRVLMSVSAMRSLARSARSRPASTRSWSARAARPPAGSANQARAETDAPALELAFEAMELYAEPYGHPDPARRRVVDIGQWLADEVSITFAEQEGAAFITGNGVGKPRGILATPTVADANYAWGKIGYVGTGGAALRGRPGGLDALISLTYALKKGYRNNAPG
jgi:HK97 family phage major capsid protein